MTTIPGPVVNVLDAAPPTTALTDTGTAFVIGLALQGKTTGALAPTDALHSLSDFQAAHGTRQTFNGPEYDTVEAFFAEGGTTLYFSRTAGPSAIRANITVPSSSPQGSVYAKGPGAYGNGGTVTIASGVATVVVAGTTEVSPTLTTVGDLQTWATNFSKLVDYVPSVATSTALTDSASRTLASGADDRASITDTERQTAIDRFGSNLGPGQVMMPGDTRTAAHTILATHARDRNRFALGDAPDSASAATVAAAGTAVRALGRELARHIQLLEPWIYAPGTTTGTSRVIPPCGVHAGLAARIDAAGNPNRAVAGVNAISRFATGLKYTRSDTERGTLGDAGVTPYINDGGIQPYDDIVPVDPVADPEWLGAAGNRLVMRIVSDALTIAKAHMFQSVSGPVDLVAFAGDLKGMLAGWFADGALYGATPADAFRVETGSTVNTPTTLANRQLKAALALKISPNARQVVVNITNVPLTGTL